MDAVTTVSTRVERPHWRARLVRTFFVTVLVAQTVLILRSYDDPHNFFGFQPFNESSTWQADIVRVTVDGRRIPIDEPWPSGSGRASSGHAGYDWDELVGWRVIQRPERTKHAYSGLDASLDFFDESLDWVADHTPLDTETLYFEAEVTGFRNTRGPEHRILRSDDREEAR